MNPSHLEIAGMVVLVLGVAGLTAAAWLWGGLGLALVVAGAALVLGGVALIKAAAALERVKPEKGAM